MKVLVEILVSIFLHPLAFLLSLINIAGRDDMSGSKKLLWAVICFFWGVGPILYIVLGDGQLW